MPVAAAPGDQIEPPIIQARDLALPGYAVPPVDPVLLSARMAEAEQWIRDFTQWRKWAAQWQNRSEMGYFGVRDRKPRPEPPVWLEDDCRGLIVGTGTLTTACHLLVDYNDDVSTAAVRRNIDYAQSQREAPTKTFWWQHVHFDGMWPTTSTAGGAFGLFGVHATMDLVGRVQVFVAPGAMLLRIPGPSGRDEFRAAPVWGFSYRLTDLNFPGLKRGGQLHANIVRAWVLSPGGLGGQVNLAGFSLTFK